MRKSTAVIASGALAIGIYAGVALNGYTGIHAFKSVDNARVITVDKKAIINALSTKAQIVGLTGKVSKTVTLNADQWYGDKTYELAATGSFKLGVDTADIIVTTQGNTVTVKYPHPKIISVDMPFDKAKISKEVGWLRQNASEGELQAMFKNARQGAVDDIERNRQAFSKAETGIKLMIERLITPIDGVQKVDVRSE